MINGIRQLPNIPALGSFSSKSAYSISSSSKSSAVAANPTSVLLAPNYLPPSVGLPMPPQSGQIVNRSNRANNKYPETLVTAIKKAFPSLSDIKLTKPDVQNSRLGASLLLSKITEFAQNEFKRELPRKAMTNIIRLGKLIEAYRIAILNKAAFERKGLVSDSPKVEQMNELAVRILVKQSPISENDEFSSYAITGNAPALWDLIQAEQNKIMAIAREIPNSSENKAEFEQFQNELSKLVENLVGINNI